MSEIKTISERLSNRAVENFDNLLDRRFDNLSHGITVDEKLYLSLPSVIDAVLDSSCIVSPLKTPLQKNSEMNIEIKVQIDQFGNIRVPIQQYYLKNALVQALRKASEKQVIEREHEKFIEQVHQIEYFKNNAEPAYEY